MFWKRSCFSSHQLSTYHWVQTSHALCTAVGWSRDVMIKWGYINGPNTCNFSKEPQNMKDLLRCHCLSTNVLSKTQWSAATGQSHVHRCGGKQSEGTTRQYRKKRNHQAFFSSSTKLHCWLTWALQQMPTLKQLSTLTWNQMCSRDGRRLFCTLCYTAYYSSSLH